MDKITVMTVDDIPCVLAMGKIMHQESSNFSFFPFCETQATATIQHIIDNGCGFVVRRDGVLIGMIGGIVVQQYFSDRSFASDLAFYVAPEYRGGRTALVLIKAFEQWAIDAGALLVYIGISTGIAPEKTVQFFNKIGYNLTGHHMTKQV